MTRVQIPIGPEAHSRILNEFRKRGGIHTEQLEQFLCNIYWTYLGSESLQTRGRSGSAKKRHIHAVHAAVSRLNSLLKDSDDLRTIFQNPMWQVPIPDPALTRLPGGCAKYEQQVHRWRAAGDERRENWETFTNVLAQLKVVLSAACDQQTRTTSKRHRKGTNVRERLYLWEPLFFLWVAYFERIGFSERGPLVRIITELHREFTIPAPNLETIREAIRSFQKAHSTRSKPLVHGGKSGREHPENV